MPHGLEAWTSIPWCWVHRELCIGEGLAGFQTGITSTYTRVVWRNYTTVPAPPKRHLAVFESELPSSHFEGFHRLVSRPGTASIQWFRPSSLKPTHMGY